MRNDNCIDSFYNKNLIFIKKNIDHDHRLSNVLGT